MLCEILLSLLAAYFLWTVYFYLFALPSISRDVDRAYLSGKVVWITGASSGIGEALSQYLIGTKNTKVVLSARSEKTLNELKQTLVNAGVSDVLVLPLDIGALADDYSLAKAAASKVLAKFGKVDVLIHNAGMSMRGEVANTVLDVDNQLMKVNYMGAVSLTKAVLPSMVERHSGHIIAMSSVQGKLPIAFRSCYAASKHAMHGFFHSLRYEVAAQGVGVSIICPGYVRTNISLNALTNDGKNYGKMDETQAKGYEPSYIADITYAAYRQNIDEVVVADLLARAAMLMYAIVPQLLTKAMLKRTAKERAKMKQ